VSKGARILVVDDDVAILRALRRGLEGEGYAVESLGRGATAAATAAAWKAEVVLLDLVLPDSDGIEICRQIRKSSDVPVIVLSAVGDDARKVRALDEGADDYLTKPFSMDELNARIRVALRHRVKQAVGTTIGAGAIQLDVARHHVSVRGEPVHLTPKEFDLCRYLMEHQGKVLTQRQILAAVWGAEYVDDSHILRTFVHQLRTKLASVSDSAAEMIVNDPGVGYRMEVPAA
jgi:two-component system KDP operon response regulator KdpE